MTAIAITMGRGSFSDGHMWPHMITQNWAEESLEMAKKQPKRTRVPIHITLSPQVIELMDKATYNRSRFIEDAILMRLSFEGKLLRKEGQLWSPGRDLNPRPADYKSAAPPG